MGSPHGRFRPPAPPRVRVAVFAVGQRVWVACADDWSARATLTDDAGKTALATLADGTEVAILAWRPGPAGTTRYRVRTTEAGLDGWLPVGSLRGTETAVPPEPAAPTPAGDAARDSAGESGDTGRRFGQRMG